MDMTFDEILALKEPTLVLFYGSACAPCTRLKPRMAQLAAEHSLRLALVNVAGELDAARALQMRGVPSVVSVRDGKATLVFTGDLKDEEILSKLKRNSVVP
jgi:thioredoxin-like negative regulator of GroEL